MKMYFYLRMSDPEYFDFSSFFGFSSFPFVAIVLVFLLLLKRVMTRRLEPEEYMWLAAQEKQRDHPNLTIQEARKLLDSEFEAKQNLIKMQVMRKFAHYVLECQKQGCRWLIDKKVFFNFVTGRCSRCGVRPMPDSCDCFYCAELVSHHLVRRWGYDWDVHNVMALCKDCMFGFYAKYELGFKDDDEEVAEIINQFNELMRRAPDPRPCMKNENRKTGGKNTNNTNNTNNSSANP